MPPMDACTLIAAGMHFQKPLATTAVPKLAHAAALLMLHRKNERGSGSPPAATPPPPTYYDSGSIEV